MGTITSAVYTALQSGLSSGPFRPPQWQNGPQPVMLIVPASPNSAQYSQNGAPAVAPSGTFVFDAAIRANHEQEWEPTHHPVQTGANISDHIIIRPAKLSLEIGMSDAMDAYQAGMWAGSDSKSVSAYQTLLAIGNARVPFTIVTRLRTYYNMAMVAAPSEETSKTYGSLRSVLRFEQLFISSTSQTASQGQSARAQTTSSTQLGTVTPQDPSQTITSQYSVGNQLSANPDSGGDGGDDIIHTGSFASQAGPIGAGNYSSVNVSNLQQTPN